MTCGNPIPTLNNILRPSLCLKLIIPLNSLVTTHYFLPTTTYFFLLLHYHTRGLTSLSSLRSVRAVAWDQLSAVCACCRSIAVARVFALVVICSIFCFVTRFSGYAKTVTPSASPGVSRAARPNHFAVGYVLLCNWPDGNCIYRPVRRCFNCFV